MRRRRGSQPCSQNRKWRPKKCRSLRSLQIRGNAAPNAGTASASGKPGPEWPWWSCSGHGCGSANRWGQNPVPASGTNRDMPPTTIKVPSPSGFRIWWIVVDPEWHVWCLATSRASARIAAIRGLPWMRDLPTAPSQDLCQADRSARDSGPLPRCGARLAPLGGSSTLTPAEPTTSRQTALTRTSSTPRLTVLSWRGQGHVEGVPTDGGSVW